ncbi:nicotinate phosphoribosyltransferase [Nocardiopsis gilva YIM 90087]|uniref:Nicotinate phosphoribosyltransferase n=1 Tax=Nocardiopsis gilva YIM 90087 TaxID=1235441 RepID=A0A223SB21_9ACTN|nr:nicotinate phosphoribosyltransferase [Nocardiopsis gilva]ASU85263.1 nicotinate phosphoribosyltransferase [Nocardiopsis gilva YIM 90087]
MTDDWSSALLTDRYELTMLQGALRSGAAHRRTVFEMFARRLPDERRYGVVAGTGRFLEALRDFRFDTPTLDFLSDNGIVDDSTLKWLAEYRFSGDIWGYGEGDVYFPGSPILVVEGTFAESVILETVALSIFNHDSAIASAASRMVTAANGRPLIEMGSRRTHEMSAVAAARAAYLTGFATTSNLEAGRRYGIPTAGTSAHAFVLAHDSERHAFTAQLDALGPETTLLVDTFDVDRAVRTAIELAGEKLGGVRLDSGDLGATAARVRDLLDQHGATGTRVLVTGDLDEYAIQALAIAPVDGYGVGTALVTGSGSPTVSLVYKLVARARGTAPDDRLEPVAKRSVGKPSKGGRKWGSRRLDDQGVATAEIVYDHEPEEEPGVRPLLRRLVDNGEIVGTEPLSAARERHKGALAELPEEARRMSGGEPAIPTLFERLHP